MKKIGDSTNTANASGEWTEGNPAAGLPATLLKADWLTTIQRELINVVLGAGVVLNKDDDSQVFKAIQALQVAASTWAKLTGKPTTISGFGITDAFTKTETGSAIQTAISALVASSPAALDTLKELATALGNDPNFATTMTNALAGKAAKATTLVGYGITDALTKTETGSAIQQAISALVASSPAALDTLKELATALGNDPNFATTMATALGERVKTSELRDAYGIGNAPVVTNLNTAGMGPFICAGGATGVPLDMAPGDYGVGYTTMGDAVAVRGQTVLIVNTGRTFRRTFGAGAWGAWGGIVDTSYQATESSIGVMRVSTEAGINGGSDDTTAVTPKKLRLGVSLSLGVNGYIVLPTWLGGLVLQWGAVPLAGTASGTVNYPIAFPTACFGGLIQSQYTTSDGSSFTLRNSAINTNGWSLSRTSFTWDSTQTARSLSLNWLAWGN